MDRRFIAAIGAVIVLLSACQRDEPAVTEEAVPDHVPEETRTAWIDHDRLTNADSEPGNWSVPHMRSTAISHLLGSGMFAAYPEPAQHERTFPAMQPTRTIDWIAFPVEWGRVAGHVPDVTLSDHRPVITEFRIR